MAVGQSLTFRDARWPLKWKPALNERQARHLWLIFACAIAALAAWQPDRTVTNNYRDAGRNWFAGMPIYEDGPHGFLYFPHAAILYAPFAFLPPPWGGILWRTVSIGGLGLAIWRLSALLMPSAKRGFCFAVLTCLVIPPALASARNGQMNLLLTGLLTLAFVEIASGRWWWAAFLLCLGAACKPLILAPLAVAAVVYRPLRAPLVCGGIALAAAPFFTQHSGYVWEQYRACAHKLLLAGNPGWENPGSDFFGMLASFGYFAPLQLQTATRVAAGGLTLALAATAVRRTKTVLIHPDKWPRELGNKEKSSSPCHLVTLSPCLDASRTGQAALSVLALTACYLALFNPRMENNGFVLIAPTMGVFAAEAFLGRRRRLVGWTMIGASLVIASYYQLAGGHNFWLCPLMGSIVWLYAIFDARRVPAAELALGGPLPDTAS